MKTNKITKIVLAVAVTGAMALPASNAMAASKTERALVGALLGGVLGAAVSNGDGGAVAIGAAAGAGLGLATAKSKNDRYYRTSSRGYRQSQPYYRDTRYQSYDRSSYGQGYGYDRTSYDRSGYGYGDYRR